MHLVCYLFHYFLYIIDWFMCWLIYSLMCLLTNVLADWSIYRSNYLLIPLVIGLLIQPAQPAQPSPASPCAENVVKCEEVIRILSVPLIFPHSKRTFSHNGLKVLRMRISIGLLIVTRRMPHSKHMFGQPASPASQPSPASPCAESTVKCEEVNRILSVPLIFPHSKRTFSHNGLKVRGIHNSINT